MFIVRNNEHYAILSKPDGNKLIAPEGWDRAVVAPSHPAHPHVQIHFKIKITPHPAQIVRLNELFAPHSAQLFV